MAGQATSNRNNLPLAVYAVAFLVFLYLPILLIPVFSFNSGAYVKFPLDGFTFQWYIDLASRTSLHQAFINSVKVGVAVAVICTILAVPAAKAISRYRMPGKKSVVGFMLLPWVVPGLIFGVALLAVLNRIGVTLNLYTVVLGQIVICLPYAISILMSRFEGFDKSIEEASANLGENGWWTFWRVTFPLVRPGILASLMMSFTISFDEWFMAAFLSGTEQTLPMYIWSQLRFPKDFPSLLALSTLILVFSFLMIFVSSRISGLGKVGQRSLSR